MVDRFILTESCSNIIAFGEQSKRNETKKKWIKPRATFTFFRNGRKYVWSINLVLNFPTYLPCNFEVTIFIYSIRYWKMVTNDNSIRERLWRLEFTISNGKFKAKLIFLLALVYQVRFNVAILVFYQ